MGHNTVWFRGRSYTSEMKLVFDCQCPYRPGTVNLCFLPR